MMNAYPSRRYILASALSGNWLLAHAQSNKPIRLVVPFTPGGTTDIVARAIAPSWHWRWAKPLSSKTSRALAARSARPKWRAPSPMV